ncbi:Tripartite ATP-independent periplasmic transporter DctQ component [Desulfonatronospira thiodismutans ASO3-1]|uniref:Tripartite ATP-independent periplasmic transporter DctQ component n=1 Tax=Desulfonatronospira thiodismutans ASO3-1 TaxID=555779 RepID=D6SP31_9BACT|nr:MULTISPECIES: TRAP transporter small permease [Desulfonatronospira]EFI34507.1 Tripartite ATP-independent periplasmic transporter DctQ component [Desulfonatronospira thiodismutans ASO3-1]RQD73370.1 MAG: TRAP transporter small permease [Desulfonatronospira sp. MSAO_Bac3]
MAKKILHILDNLERYICVVLLSFFVIVLFFQIFLRAAFSIVLPWSEELSRFCFVWFVFFGASYAARLYAHNRVTMQFKLFRPAIGKFSQIFTDFIWIGFNVTMIHESIKVINNMQLFAFHSPALGWNMAYLYYIFPISFTLMSLRIIQVNYIMHVKKEAMGDVDKVDAEAMTKLAEKSGN